MESALIMTEKTDQKNDDELRSEMGSAIIMTEKNDQRTMMN
jgi:hypothetical protein